jgi:hypothetical protein
MSSHRINAKRFSLVASEPVSGAAKPSAANVRFCGIGPREEDKVMLVLLAVSLIRVTVVASRSPARADLLSPPHPRMMLRDGTPLGASAFPARKGAADALRVI